MFILNQNETHMKLIGISHDHQYSIYEFYLEYFKNNYDSVKKHNKVLDMMFSMSHSILSIKHLLAKDLKNIIEFWTFILKKSEEESTLAKIIEWAKQMVFTSSANYDTVRNSISSFIKMIYFNPKSIWDTG